MRCHWQSASAYKFLLSASYLYPMLYYGFSLLAGSLGVRFPLQQSTAADPFLCCLTSFASSSAFHAPVTFALSAACKHIAAGAMCFPIFFLFLSPLFATGIWRSVLDYGFCGIFLFLVLSRCIDRRPTDTDNGDSSDSSELREQANNCYKLNEIIVIPCCEC